MKTKHLVNENKKCVLISSPEFGKYAPRNLLSLATYLNRNGFSTAVIPLAYYLDYDPQYTDERLKSVLSDIVQAYNPFTIGVSCMTPDVHSGKNILKICKELNHNVITLMGGIHPTFMDTSCIELPYVDIVVRGEGEWTLLELISALEKGSDLNAIKGLTYKEKDKIIRTSDRPMGDLDELPPLDFSLLPQEFTKNCNLLGMMSRGCAFNCYFCADKRFWKTVRHLPVSHTIHEMETLSLSYNNQMTAIEDNMVYIGSETFSSLCAIIKERKIQLKPDFYVLTRVDMIVEEHGLKDMENTGITNVILGIESGAPNVLKMMNKKTNPDTIISGCKKLRKYGLQPIGVWMIGHPGDTPEETERSLEFLTYLLDNDLMHAAHFTYFIPWPGTCFHDDPKKYGIEILVDNWANWDYYEVNGIRKPIFQLKDFSNDEMTHYYYKAYDIVEKKSALPFWFNEGLLGKNRGCTVQDSR
jgi:radical SAM superfamily enzyme YgiQ (UPF0313 family)